MLLLLSLLYNLKQYSKTEKGAAKLHPLTTKLESCANVVRGCAHGFRDRFVECRAHLREHNRIRPLPKKQVAIAQQQRFDKFDRHYKQQRRRLLMQLKVCGSEKTCIELTAQLKALEEENSNQEQMFLHGILQRTHEETSPDALPALTDRSSGGKKKEGAEKKGAATSPRKATPAGVMEVSKAALGGSQGVEVVGSFDKVGAMGSGDASLTPRKRIRKPDPIFDALVEASIRKTDARIYAKTLRNAGYTRSSLSSVPKKALLEQFQMKPLHVKKFVAFVIGGRHPGEQRTIKSKRSGNGLSPSPRKGLSSSPERGGRSSPEHGGRSSPEHCGLPAGELSLPQQGELHQKRTANVKGSTPRPAKPAEPAVPEN
jgi:hypothetical protein